MRRVDSVAESILKGGDGQLIWYIENSQDTHPESGQTLLPATDTRVPDEVQHLLVIVDIEALVGDGERESDR